MNFLYISKKFSGLDNSKAIILKIPYESTTSYGHGCGKGPEAIIKASAYVELFDEEYNFKPHTLGISTQGISAFSKKHEKNLDLIGKEFVKYYNRKKFVIALGGEHSITIGIVNALSKKIKDLSVIHFDAHMDLRNYYQKSYYSHACAMRRVFEITPQIAFVGIRSYSAPEYNFMRKKKIEPIFARDMENLSAEQITDEIFSITSKNVYITFDVDYFALDVVRDTGTPEPGGPGWYKTLEILRGIFSEKNVVGMDVVELIGDTEDDQNISAFSSALLVKKCIVYKFGGSVGSV